MISVAISLLLVYSLIMGLAEGGWLQKYIKWQTEEGGESSSPEDGTSDSNSGSDIMTAQSEFSLLRQFSLLRCVFNHRTARLVRTSVKTTAAAATTTTINTNNMGN